MYLIEPLPHEKTGQQDGAHSGIDLHAIYNYKHLRRKRSSCSHGNTTTFYDHGARPSGLFQLGSLVRMPHGHIHRLCGFTLLIICAADSFRRGTSENRLQKIEIKKIKLHRVKHRLNAENRKLSWILQILQKSGEVKIWFIMVKKMDTTKNLTRLPEGKMYWPERALKEKKVTHNSKMGLWKCFKNCVKQYSNTNVRGKKIYWSTHWFEPHWEKKLVRWT